MKYFKPVFRKMKKPFKWFKVYLKQRLGWLGVPKIEVFRGYANSKVAIVRGIVLEDKGLVKPKEKHKVWTNILATIKRFSSDEIPGVRVKAEFLGQQQEVISDQNGFFVFEFNTIGHEQLLKNKNWNSVYVKLMDELVENQPEVKATGEVRLISELDDYIFVSDIDDTALISHSTQTFRKLHLMLFKNALTRLPFPGVSSLYRRLSAGKSGQKNYPFFFVSSSEWNLYDLLEDFFHYHHFPKGVFLLKRLENSVYKFWKSGGGTHLHKYEKIRDLMKMFTDQEFILIGDSGQRDPELYLRIVREFPGRVKVVYIRNVRKVKPERVKGLFQGISNNNSKLIFAKDTLEVARHAASIGLISKEDVEAIQLSD